MQAISIPVVADVYKGDLSKMLVRICMHGWQAS